MYGKHQAKLDMVNVSPNGAEKVAARNALRNEVACRDRRRSEESEGELRLVVEATGSPTGLALAQQITEPRGTLVLKSTFHGATAVETWPIVVKEITVVDRAAGPSPMPCASFANRK